MAKSSKRRRGRKKFRWGKFLAGLFLGIATYSLVANWQPVAGFLSGLLHIRLAGAYTLPEAEVIGIDVSYYQGDIAWDALQFNYQKPTRVLTNVSTDASRKVDFVYAKATEGESLKDSKYKLNKIACSKLGIPFGAYHFFVPGVSARLQASNFIKTAGIAKGNLIPVLDVENAGSLTEYQLLEAVKTFCDEVEKACGVRPLIYTYLKFYNNHFKNEDYNGYRFWIAAYSREKIDVGYVMWQQTSRGRVGGISGNVDVDLFNGSKSEFMSKYVIK